ncbi:MAG: adenosylmethionine--8-amino-7-oxononanoate transaminase [Planctomycetota bacterium]
MPTNEEITHWDRHNYWHSFTQMGEYDSLVIERADGVWLYDIEGNRYLDGVSSIWCNLLGHGHPEINKAIRQQLDLVAHSTSLGMGSRPAAQLAHKLAEIAPGDLQHVFLASDGSSATEVALKMAFQYWLQCEKPRPEKTKYLALGQAYHGDTLGSSSVGGIARFHEIFEPLLFDVIRLPAPDPRALPDEIEPAQAAEYFLGQLDVLLAEHHENIAAFVLEPLIQAAAGMIFHPPGYLTGVRELTKKYDVLLITDEIVTGFGRTRRMFACDHEDVVPDILCLGKSITGGYLPLSATITHAKIYDAFVGDAASGRALMHGHTYSGNQLAAAAALATIEALEADKVKQNVEDRTAQLRAWLDRLTSLPHVAETRQHGLIAAVELCALPDTKQPFPPEARIAAQIGRHALSHGVWIRPLRDTLVIMPPITITTDELDFLCETIYRSIEHVTAESAVASGKE